MKKGWQRYGAHDYSKEIMSKNRTVKNIAGKSWDRDYTKKPQDV
jgi:hypothetical protein